MAGASPPHAAAGDDGLLLYHEPQVGALCGVHCLNTLLQGPCFTETDLATLAAELEAAEAALLPGGRAPGEHGHATDSGMFSVAVLERALAAFDISVANVGGEGRAGVRLAPETHGAYVVNRADHWFAVRRLGGSFWDLNSLLPAPRRLSDFHLAAFFADTTDVYAVEGVLPRAAPPGDGGGRDGPGRWFTPAEADGAAAQADAARRAGAQLAAAEGALALASAGGRTLTLRPRGGPDAGRPADGTDADLQQAIAASLGVAAGRASSTPAGPRPAADDDADLQAAIEASFGDGSGGRPGVGGAEKWRAEARPSAASAVPQPPAPHRPASSPSTALPGDDADDDLMQAAIAASLQAGGVGGGRPPPPPTPPPSSLPALDPEPGPGPGTVTLALRLADGRRLVRRFDAAAPAAQVGAFLAGHGVDVAAHRAAAPGAAGLDLEGWETLQATGLAGSVALNIVRKG